MTLIYHHEIKVCFMLK